MKTIALVSCTTKINSEDTLLYKSLQKINKERTPYSVFDYYYFWTDNKEGLSKRYNEFLDHHGDDFDYIVFAHDDIFIDDYGVIEKLKIAHEDYDIVGLAGGVSPSVKEPCLWHIMCGGFGPNLRGFVGHYTSNNSVAMTNFGPTPARVAIADGLFLSINTHKAKSVGWKFNENYDFHLYDIASCIDANNLKLKIGVYPILVYHMSPGLRSLSDTVFLNNQAKFMKEYTSH
jgi:hypothetical protein